MGDEVAPVLIMDTGEKEVILFIERYHAENGVVPKDDVIYNYLRTMDLDCDLEALYGDARFQESMAVRGIDTTLNYGQLSAKQMGAVAVMMSYIDRRSDEKKLRDLGLTPREWATWMQNETFAKYVRNYSERLVNNAMHEAHMGLVKGMRQGNTASIKLFYELTGRHSDNQTDQVNVKLLLHKIIEIIQKYVKDPQTLQNLSTEMLALSAAVDQIQKQQTIRGEIRG